MLKLPVGDLEFLECRAKTALYGGVWLMHGYTLTNTQKLLTLT